MCFLSLSVVTHAKEKPPIHVVGDVGGRIAIIVVRTKMHGVLLFLIINFRNVLLNNWFWEF